MFIAENHTIAPHTTFGLGGKVRFYSEARNGRDLVYSLDLAKENNTPVFILGSGSNVLFPDDPSDIFVIHMAIPGITVTQEFTDTDGKNYVRVRAQGGQDWDDFVLYTLKAGWSGLEPLSGIPGTAGAAVVQNIGAYGAEVSAFTETVIAMDLISREVHFFPKEECGFGYRTSRFKGTGRYIIMGAEFLLRKSAVPRIHYADLQNYIKNKGFNPDDLTATPESHLFVRDCVMDIRRSKGMLYSKSEESLRSAGSFFKNPLVKEGEPEIIRKKLSEAGLLEGGTEVPFFRDEREGGFKIPAAFLIERCGFKKGYREAGAGISELHALSIVNLGGTSADVKKLARKIQDAVVSFTGVQLEPEVIIL